MKTAFLMFTLATPAWAQTEAQLQMLLKRPEVKSAYDACTKEGAQEKIADCIWGDGGTYPGKLTDKQKEDIAKLIQQGQEGRKDTTSEYGGVNIADVKQDDPSKTDTKSKEDTRDPAIAKLEDYYFKRLREALHGEINQAQKGRGGKLVDHQVFYQLFETQISKNIILAISSYCMDAVMVKNGHFLILSNEQLKQEARKANIELLKNFPPGGAPQAPGTPGKSDLTAKGGASPEAYGRWGACAVSIQDVCHEKGTYNKALCAPTPPSTTDPIASVDGQGGGVCGKGDFEYAQKRACEVTNYLRAARQDLIRIGELQEVIKQGVEKDGQYGLAAQNVELYNPNKDGASLDDLTTVSSGELAEKSGYQAEAKKQAEEFAKKCAQEANEETCKKRLATGDQAKDMKEGLNELDLRTRALESKLVKLKENDELIKYLKEEGRSDEEIKKLMEDPETLRNAISAQFKKEREAVIASLRERQGQSVAKGVDKVDPKAADKGAVDQIAQELKSEPQRMLELTHFNNIITGYLQLKTEGKDENSRNTSSLFREIEDSAFDPNKGKIKSGNLDPTYFEELKSNTQNNVQRQDTENAARVPVGTMNEQILDYK